MKTNGSAERLLDYSSSYSRNAEEEDPGSPEDTH